MPPQSLPLWRFPRTYYLLSSSLTLPVISSISITQTVNRRRYPPIQNELTDQQSIPGALQSQLDHVGSRKFYHPPYNRSSPKACSCGRAKAHHVAQSGPTEAPNQATTPDQQARCELCAPARSTDRIPKFQMAPESFNYDLGHACTEHTEGTAIFPSAPARPAAPPARPPAAAGPTAWASRCPLCAAPSSRSCHASCTS